MIKLASGVTSRSAFDSRTFLLFLFFSLQAQFDVLAIAHGILELLIEDLEDFEVVFRREIFDFSDHLDRCLVGLFLGCLDLLVANILLLLNDYNLSCSLAILVVNIFNLN